MHNDACVLFTKILIRTLAISLRLFLEASLSKLYAIVHRLLRVFHLKNVPFQLVNLIDNFTIVDYHSLIIFDSASYRYPIRNEVKWRVNNDRTHDFF